MKILVIDQSAVRRLLPMEECIEVVGRALAALAEERAANPLRHLLWLPDRRGLLGMMPASLADPPVVGIKVVTFFPANHGTELDSHQGMVLLFETARGRPLAVVDASEITAIRTAAASGVATRALARPGASRLAILGSGVQARTHLAAMLAVRPVAEVKVCSLTLESARRFAAAESERHGLAVEAVATPREAVAGADLICTTTSAREPVLEGAWLAPGVHVNAVGSSLPTARELDAAAVARARLFVDRRESALNEAGDFLMARAEGAVDDDHILGEIGDLLVGRLPGRQSDEEITLFKSLGLAIEDLSAAHHVWRRARETGAGEAIEFSGPPGE